MIKKVLPFLICFILLIGLTACNSSQKADSSEDNSFDQEVDGEDQSKESEKEIDDQNQSKASENEVETENNNDTNDKLSNFEEKNAIEENIDITGLEVNVETDTDNKRVILFEDQNHHKVYKTIFIKSEKRIKIIDIKKDNGLIYNEII
ncbi:hypothetical protein SPD48_01955 [Pseudogracilibacillus sp. SE30717A]|uniref:hypothetical protein n=1 Tax=Pseudogracilibacillus sp. SE30717A TaxID=3098293 RepID=UPI00300E3B7D